MSGIGSAVLVCGGRDRDIQWLTIANEVADLTVDRSGDVTVVNGGCGGVDQSASKAADKMGWQCIEMWAQWSKHGKAAGPKRNQAMLDVLDRLCTCGWHAFVLAYPSAKSRGTWDTVRRAQDMGFNVVIRDEPGT